MSNQMNASMSLMASLKHNHKMKLHLKKVQKASRSERVPFSNQIARDMRSEWASSCRPAVPVSQMDQKTKPGRPVSTSSAAELARGMQMVLEPSSARAYLPEIRRQLLDSWFLTART
jgi:hypothetical protein